jgi:plasmid maintenance system antidote protein VapI
MPRLVIDSTARFDDTAMRRDVLAYMDRWRLSQRAMARSVGMSEGTVARWFRGEGRVSMDFAASLAQVCDLSLDAYVERRSQ